MMGYEYSEIQWTGPITFYARVADAQMQPHLLVDDERYITMMSRRIGAGFLAGASSVASLLVIDGCVGIWRWLLWPDP